MIVKIDGFDPTIKDDIYYGKEDSFLEVRDMPNKQYVKIFIKHKDGRTLEVVVNKCEMAKSLIPF